MKATILQAQSHNHIFIDWGGFLKTQAVNHVPFKHYSCHSGTNHSVKCLKLIRNTYATCDLHDENKRLCVGKFHDHINFYSCAAIE